MSDVPEFEVMAITRAGSRSHAVRVVDYALREGILGFDVAIGPKGVDAITHWGSARPERAAFGPSIEPALEELVRGPQASGTPAQGQYIRYVDLAETQIGAAYGTIATTPEEGLGLVRVMTPAQWLDTLGLEVKDAPDPLDADATAAFDAMVAAAQAAEDAAVLPDVAAEQARLRASLALAYVAAFGSVAEAKRQHQVGGGLAHVLNLDNP